LDSKSLPTEDEIINTLKRSYLPTILIEGTDDLFVYRWLKSKLDNSLVSLQPCGGRNSLFSIYDRKEEFLDKNIVFIADKDAYRFDGIPENRNDIIFTTGYCIENDIFDGSNIEEFIDQDDQHNHNLLRDVIGRWFVFQLKEYQEKIEKAQKTLCVAVHINVVSPKGLGNICPNYAESIGYSEPDTNLVNNIFQDYNLNIRGKQLFQMLSRFLSKKGRFSSFSEKNLIEIALKNGENINIDKLVLQINSKLLQHNP
jgi:hypothetical protein